MMSDIINAAKQAPVNRNMAKHIMPLIDLTSLNESDTNKTIEQLCKNAETPLGPVAAICIYPRFVSYANHLLQNTHIKIATVANFPQGDTDLDITLKIIEQSCNEGADEIDVVMPYQAYLSGDHQFAVDYINACKSACSNQAILKVILETGVLQTPDLIIKASNDAINAGADFIKTSTGKITVGATLEAAYFMLQAIHDAQKQGKNVGFKAAGGIRTLEQAIPYMYIAKTIMGESWISPDTFRFGASTIIADLLGSPATNHNQTTY